ncbi:MAG: LamG domain-containing protein [Verrucomicrobiales bacterium]|nr:LamG domain-containing protein [Verrucomicrobiales bacterium]
MKTPFLFVLSLVASSLLFADEHGDLIFSDDFERTESQEEKDEPGNGWGTNSRTRAKGNKQVDLVDGAMRIYIHEEADHAVSVTQPFEFTDGAVALRFKLEDDRDSIGLNFADLKEKSVHAGHLFMVKISPKQVQINDLKTGNMKLEIREARQNKTVTPEQSKMLKEKQVKFPHKTEVGEWHDVLAQIDGDTFTLSLDGEKVGEFSSPGIAHPTKRMLRLSVPKNVVVDDVKFWRRK